MVAAVFAVACSESASVGGKGPPGPGSGGAGPYSRCLCEVETLAYLDLSFVGLADTVTGTRTIDQDRVVLRVDGVHWASSGTFPLPLTAGSTVTLGAPPDGASDPTPVDFSPSFRSVGYLQVFPVPWSERAGIVPGTRFFALLSRLDRVHYFLWVNEVSSDGDPICPLRPDVRVTRAELISILQSHEDWRDAWAACVRKLEETGGPIGGFPDAGP
jgi:hypothetical protein